METAGIAISVCVGALTLAALLWRYIARPIYRGASGAVGFFASVRDGLAELRDLIREFTRYMQTTERRFEAVESRLLQLEGGHRHAQFPR